VQGNAFEQVAERQVKVFRQSFEHLEEPLFQPDAGLNAFDFARRGVRIFWRSWRVPGQRPYGE
jgi:hypothetical protein